MSLDFLLTTCSVNIGGNVMNEQSSPYTCSKAFFPADSKFPQQTETNTHDDQISPDVRHILKGIMHDLHELSQLLDYHILTWPEISIRLTKLGHLMTYIYIFFDSELQKLVLTENGDTSIESLGKVFCNHTSEAIVG